MENKMAGIKVGDKLCIAPTYRIDYQEETTPAEVTLVKDKWFIADGVKFVRAHGKVWEFRAVAYRKVARKITEEEYAALSAGGMVTPALSID